jgi:DNA repair protein RadC
LKHFKLNAAVVLAGARAACEYFEPIFQERTQELTIVALCDSGVRLNKMLSFPGSTGSCQISLGDVFREALDCNAMIVAHNHPSGNCQPSEADIRLTRKLSQICQIIDVAFLDHLIFADSQMFSFRGAGLI